MAGTGRCMASVRAVGPEDFRLQLLVEENAENIDVQMRCDVSQRLHKSYLKPEAQKGRHKDRKKQSKKSTSHSGRGVYPTPKIHPGTLRFDPGSPLYMRKYNIFGYFIYTVSFTCEKYSTFRIPRQPKDGSDKLPGRY
jgi:hypothetical protein